MALICEFTPHRANWEQRCQLGKRDAWDAKNLHRPGRTSPGTSPQTDPSGYQLAFLAGIEPSAIEV